MQRPSGHRSSDALTIALLCAVVCAVFAGTVEYRRPWFGTIGTIESFFITPTLAFTKNWYREGLLNLRFAMYWNPRSVEFRDLPSRELYTSYPPGACLPVFALSKLLGREPSLTMIMAYNLAGQFAAALFLSLAVFLLLRRIHYSNGDAFVLALVPGLIYLLTPGPLCHHLMGYFADQSVVVPYALYILLEVVRDGEHGGASLLPGRSASSPEGDPSIGKRSRVPLDAAIAILQSVVAFYGVLTDWLFGVLLLCAYGKRLFSGDLGGGIVAFLRKSILFWLPTALALAAFVLQLAVNRGFEALAAKFVERTGIGRSAFLSLSMDMLWRKQMPRAYGETGVVLLWGGLAFVLAAMGAALVLDLLGKRLPPRLPRVLGIAFLAIVPPFLHAYLLKNHASHPFHYFTTLKFAIPLAVVPFVLAPAIGFVVFDAVLSRGSRTGSAAILRRLEPSPMRRLTPLPPILLALAVLYLFAESPRIAPQFRILYRNMERVARLLERNTAYEDVAYSWENDLISGFSDVAPWTPMAMKRLYVLLDIDDAKNAIARIPGPCRVDLVGFEGTDRIPPPEIERLLDYSRDARIAGDIRLDMIRKNEFLAFDEAKTVSANPDTP